LPELSQKLVGFLEIIPEHKFRALQEQRYPSLYSFNYSSNNSSQPKTYFCVLFGTVAFCNSSQATNVQFWNFTEDDNLLLWKTTMTINEEVMTSNDQGYTRFQTGDFFEVKDGKRIPGRNSIAPYAIENINELSHTIYMNNDTVKSKLFVKVILHDVSIQRFQNTTFTADEEVFVRYNLTDPLI